MRDHSFDPQSFLRELDGILSEFAKDSEVLSRLTPNDLQRFENRYVLKSNRLEHLVFLCIFQWYLPKGPRELLLLELEQKIKQLSNLDFLQLLLQSKVECLLFLINTRKWHTRDFFGNVLSEKQRKQAICSISCLYRTRRKPKHPVRHRGYRDKGTLKPSYKHREQDLWLTQLKIEEQRKILKSTFAFARGYLE